MKLDKKQVEHIAKLARIKLSEKEKDLYSSQLTEILNYVEQLKEVKTEGIETTPYVLKQINIFRKDKVQKKEGREKLLNQAPQKEGDYFKVKSVLGD